MTGPDPRVPAALREERAFVHALGGYSLEIPGGTLVTNERVPVAALNFVQEVRLSVERQTAFFERALDHYFQRALRPTFRVEEPAPPHVESTLVRLGFHLRANPRTLLVAAPGAAPASPVAPPVRVAEADEVDLVASFWAGDEERDELRRALDVVLHHPNPGEEMTALLAGPDGAPSAAALVYRSGPTAGVHAVATQPAARGQGLASALVAAALSGPAVATAELVTIWDDSGRLAGRLGGLGFRPAARFRVFELPPGAELAIPPPGPPTPPRWRPPRRRDAGA